MLVGHGVCVSTNQHSPNVVSAAEDTQLNGCPAGNIQHACGVLGCLPLLLLSAQALNLFRKKTGRNDFFEVKLDKHVPHGRAQL